MAGKKIDVFYQPPGKTEWQHVESQVRERASHRRVARALLVEADVAAMRLMAAVRPAAKPVRGLTPEEIFESQMARELGAWGRYVEVEVRRFSRSAEIAIDELFGKKR